MATPLGDMVVNGVRVGRWCRLQHGRRLLDLRRHRRRLLRVRHGPLCTSGFADNVTHFVHMRDRPHGASCVFTMQQRISVYNSQNYRNLPSTIKNRKYYPGLRCALRAKFAIWIRCRWQSSGCTGSTAIRYVLPVLWITPFFSHDGPYSASRV